MSDNDRVKPYLCGQSAPSEPVFPVAPAPVRGVKEHERLFPGHHCFYCGGPSQSVDHVIPRSKGGLDTNANKVPACLRCNQMKADMRLDEFLAHIERILQTVRSKKIQFPIQFGGDQLLMVAA